MRVLALIVLAGCDKLLSLDPIAPATGDATPPRVTGTFVEHYVTNDSHFMPMRGEYVPPSVAATATLDDGTTSPVSYDSDGSFSFALAHAGQRYRLAMTSADGGGDIEAGAAQLSLGLELAARPSVMRTPTNASTILDLHLAGTLTATSGVWITSTGQWTQTATSNTSGTFQFDWRSAGAFAPPIGLLDASGYHDKLFVVVLESSPYYYFSQWYTIPIDLVDGTTTTITDAFSPATSPGCIELDTPLVQSAAAWQQTEPDTTAVYGYAGVDAVPVPGFVNGGLFVTQFVHGAPLVPDSPQTLGFYDPYPGSTLVAYSGILLKRLIQLPGTTQPFLGYLGSSVGLLAPDVTTCSTLAIDPSVVARPSGITVDGVAITADAMAVPAAGPLEVSWQTSSPADFTTVTLYELVAVSGYTVPHRLDSTATTASSLRFDASLVHAGGSYVVRLSTTIGSPGAATGDYVTHAYPYGNANQWSHYFTLQ